MGIGGARPPGDPEYPFTVAAGSVRPPADPAGARRAFLANLIGAFSLAVQDQIGTATYTATGRRGHAAATLLTLLWYPDRPISFLAERLGISHPGAVQLADRLTGDGLVERIPGEDGRSRLLALTPHGEQVALAVLAARRAVLSRAAAALDDRAVAAATRAVGAMLAVFADELVTSEQVCRMCDELACPDERCPVERALPTPPRRRGLGYGVPDT